MLIQFRCPRCQTQLSIPDHLAGSNIVCPRCHGTISTPLVALPVSPPPMVPAAKLLPSNPFSFIEPEPLRDKKPVRRQTIELSVRSVGVAGFVLIALGIGISHFFHRLEAIKTAEVLVSTTREVKPIGTHESTDISITLSPFRLPALMYNLHIFELSIKSNTPVNVQHVLYNGTYEPKVDTTFSAGNVLALSVGRPKGSAYAAYELDHVIEFIDIYTTRGSFRFDPNGLLIGQPPDQPRADTRQLTQLEDAKIAAKETAIVDARKAMFQEGDTRNPLLKKHSHDLGELARSESEVSEVYDYLGYSYSAKGRRFRTWHTVR
jgi:hypothetical protein